MHNPIGVMEECVRFAGKAGRLAGVLSYPEKESLRGAVLVIGPHPLLGGDAENNVVRAVASGLAAAGHLTLRFDYRGVGESEGPPVTSTDNIDQFLATSRIDAEAGFAEDVSAAAIFLRTLGENIVAAVGYSFGAWLAARWSSTQDDVEDLILVAPTITQHDYSLLKQNRRRKLVLASADDFAVSQNELHQQFAEWAEPKELRAEPMDNHFFRGFEAELVGRIASFLRKRSSATPSAPVESRRSTSLGRREGALA